MKVVNVLKEQDGLLMGSVNNLRKVFFLIIYNFHFIVKTNLFIVKIYFKINE